MILNFYVWDFKMTFWKILNYQSNMLFLRKCTGSEPTSELARSYILLERGIKIRAQMSEKYLCPQLSQEIPPFSYITTTRFQK